MGSTAFCYGQHGFTGKPRLKKFNNLVYLPQKRQNFETAVPWRIIIKMRIEEISDTVLKVPKENKFLIEKTKISVSN